MTCRHPHSWPLPPALGRSPAAAGGGEMESDGPGWGEGNTYQNIDMPHCVASPLSSSVNESMSGEKKLGNSLNASGDGPPFLPMPYGRALIRFILHCLAPPHLPSLIKAPHHAPHPPVLFPFAHLLKISLVVGGGEGRHGNARLSFHFDSNVANGGIAVHAAASMAYVVYTAHGWDHMWPCRGHPPERLRQQCY
jgi:hypothetical protein